MNRRRFRTATFAIALVGAVAVWIVSTELFPFHSLNHDEGVYLQQAAMLVDGQLRLHPPIDGLRPWFFVEGAGGLSPKYAPVPAAMFALGELFGGYRLALPAIAAGILAGVAGVTSEVVDRRSGLLAAVFVLASPLFLLDTAVFLPYAPTTLLNLAFASAYLRADRTGRVRWAALAGAAIGLAFFARPYTAVLFATPFVAHACWTLVKGWRAQESPGWQSPPSSERRSVLARQATTAGVGLAGVALALGYNAVVTGAPFTFPYEAFAPLDGPGFGYREILDHGVEYTPTLALSANVRVLTAFGTQWFAGGLAGVALALGGVVVAVRHEWSARVATLVGLLVTIPIGNAYFWGNYNILGALDRPGDGLIAALGPYYHFDLLVPTAIFAAVGALAAVDAVRTALDGRFDRPTTRTVVLALALASALVMGAITASGAAAPVERNQAVTETYETAYEPFEPHPPADSVVLVPTPYGPWLNHPFQALRNDPGYDDRTVYAMADRPFALRDAFPDRTLYRYGYRGVWDPLAGSPEGARLQRVVDRTGERIVLNASVGLPDGATSATVTVESDAGAIHAVGDASGEDLDLRVTVEDGRVVLTGPLDAVGNESLAVDGREDVRTSVFVDYGASGVEYRLTMPIEVDDGGDVRALTPQVEYCLDPRACGGAATLVPETVPEDVFVRTDLQATDGVTDRWK